jgi:hypothetical protein
MHIRGMTSTLIGFLRSKSFYALNDAHLFADSFPNHYDHLINSKGLKISNKSTYEASLKRYIRSTIVHQRVPLFSENQKYFELEMKRQAFDTSLIHSVELIKRSSNLRDELIAFSFLIKIDSPHLYYIFSQL